MFGFASIMLTVTLCFKIFRFYPYPLQWCHNKRDALLNHRRLDCLLIRLSRRRSRNTSKLRTTGFVREIHQWPVDSPHKGQVTRQIFPSDDVTLLRVYFNGDWNIRAFWVNPSSAECHGRTWTPPLLLVLWLATTSAALVCRTNISPLPSNLCNFSCDK